MGAKDYFEAIRRCRRAHELVQASVLAHLRSRGVEAARIREILQEIEETYQIRLFAVFEAVLRDYWRAYRKRTSHPRMEVLIDRVAAYQDVSPQRTKLVHEVREWRNHLVHQSRRPNRIGFNQACTHCCKFMAFLPWEKKA
jgi:hypothetical protein